MIVGILFLLVLLLGVIVFTMKQDAIEAKIKPTECGNGITERGENCSTCPQDMANGTCKEYERKQDIISIKAGCENSEFKDKNECINSGLYEQAAILNDPEYCREIIEDLKKTMCLDQISLEKALNEDDVDACKTSIQEKDCRSTFYMIKAEKEKNESYCDLLEDEEQKTFCYDSLILEEVYEKKQCERLQNEMLRDECKIITGDENA